MHGGCCQVGGNSNQVVEARKAAFGGVVIFVFYFTFYFKWVQLLFLQSFLCLGSLLHFDLLH